MFALSKKDKNTFSIDRQRKSYKMKETILSYLSVVLVKKLQLEESLSALEEIWGKLKSGQGQLQNREEITASLFHLQQCSLAFTGAISHLFETLNQEN